MNGFFGADPGLEIRRLREALPDRRERIATAAMKGLLISGRYFHKPHIAEEAVEAADALIAELDKKEGGT